MINLLSFNQVLQANSCDFIWLAWCSFSDNLKTISKVTWQVFPYSFKLQLGLLCLVSYKNLYTYAFPVHFPGIGSAGSRGWNCQWPWVCTAPLLWLNYNQGCRINILNDFAQYLLMAVFKTYLTFFVCSYKFEFPTPDDRPGPPIISFRSADHLKQNIEFLLSDNSLIIMASIAIISRSKSYLKFFASIWVKQEPLQWLLKNVDSLPNMKNLKEFNC